MKLFNLTAKIFVIAALLVVGSFAPREAVAEDDIMCAEVYACDDQGELKKEYRELTGPCFVKYNAQCERARAEDRKQCGAVSESYNQLQEKFAAQQAKLGKLQKKIRQLRKASK